MARQNPDGSHPTDSKRSNYGDLFSAAVGVASDTWHWSQVDGTLVAQAIDAVTRRGDAISFARNRTGTAGSVTLLTGPDRPKIWFNTYDEAEQFLGRLADA